jgi:hypothetical protein
MPKTHADACPGPRFCILIAWVLPATSPDACADLPVGARRAAGRAAPSALVLAVGAAPPRASVVPPPPSAVKLVLAASSSSPVSAAPG